MRTRSSTQRLTLPPEGVLISRRRADLGMSQAELGRKVMFSAAWISVMERGRSSKGDVQPSIDSYARVARELGMNSDEWYEAASAMPQHRRRLCAIADAIAKHEPVPKDGKIDVQSVVLVIESLRRMCGSAVLTAALARCGFVPAPRKQTPIKEALVRR